ncbi:hypothetical protein Hanom_Chr09g00820431 [Helianthus anomalus]
MSTSSNKFCQTFKQLMTFTNQIHHGITKESNRRNKTFMFRKIGNKEHLRSYPS